ALDAGEVDDLVEAADDLGAAQPEDRPVEEDVLAARELRMEAGAHLEQAADAAMDLGAARRRRRDAREDLQQGALAGAVAADDADRLAARDLEAHVAQRPQFLVVAAAERAAQPARERALFAEAVALRQAEGADRDVAHR